jgi:CxC5 like cysteine cluster associated with KDZ transposases
MGHHWLMLRLFIVMVRRLISDQAHRIDCKIRHYHNFYTVDKRRIYYPRSLCGSAVPNYIHYEEHKFIEAKLCELFTNLMVFAWYGHCPL